jgi:hypothetical protein
MTDNDCRAIEPRYCWKHGSSIKPSSYLPNYDQVVRRRDEAQNVIMTSPWQKARREAERELEALATRVDASEEGYEQVGTLYKNAVRDGDRLTASFAQQRIQKADALRAKLLADEAVASWLVDNPHNLERLFDGTGHKATRSQNGNVVVQAPGAREFTLFRGDDENQLSSLFEYRKRIADWQRYVETYNTTQITEDLPSGYTLQQVAGDGQKFLVRDPAGKALVHIQLNEDSSFQRAVVNSPYDDGSIAEVPSLLALRATLFKLDGRNNGPLPAWASGDSEPQREPVVARTSAAESDQLF